MAAPDGVLSSQEKQKIVEWLNKKTKNSSCPVCLTNSWTIADHLIRGDANTPGGTRLSGPSYPFAMVICNNCYYVRHFLSIPMGVGKEVSEEQNSETKTGNDTNV